MPPVRVQHRQRAETRPDPDPALVRDVSRDLGHELACKGARVERRGRVGLVAVDGLDERGAQRGDSLFPAHDVEEARQRGVLRILGAVVRDEERCLDAGRVGRRVQLHVDARDEATAADLEPLDRAGIGDRVEPCGRLILGPFDDRLVAERTGRTARVRRVGQEAAVDREQVLHAVDVASLELETPGAVVPLERRAEPRARDLLREQDLAVDAVGVGQAELDRVLPDAGRPQRGFLGRF